MHYLYILYSDSSQKFYIGETNDLESRIEKHQKHFYSNSFTKIAEDWKIVLTLDCIERRSYLFRKIY